jgi:hypothetical protein
VVLIRREQRLLKRPEYMLQSPWYKTRTTLQFK